MVHLGQIDSLSLARRRTLEAAGVSTVEDLARVDVADLARKTRIPEAPLRDFKRKAAAIVVHEAVRDVGKALRGIGPASIPALAEVAAESLLQALSESLRRGADGLKAIRQPPGRPLASTAKAGAGPPVEEPIASFGPARPPARAVEAGPLQMA